MKIKGNYKLIVASKWYLLFEFIFLIILPLIAIDILEPIFKYRHHLLVAGVIYAFTLARAKDISFSDMGLHRVNFREALLRIAPFVYYMCLA